MKDTNGAGGASKDIRRRKFLTSIPSVAMAGGLAGSYGAFFLMAGRFLYPAKPLAKAWMLVAPADSIPRGKAHSYRTPSGTTVSITRQGDGRRSEDFIALSSTCPHLGCHVHWQSQHDWFFCPCHNGVFDPQGAPVSGPPAEAGQSLPRYPLKVENGLLFIEVPVETVARSSRTPPTVPATAGPAVAVCQAEQNGQNLPMVPRACTRLG